MAPAVAFAKNTPSPAAPACSSSINEGLNAGVNSTTSGNANTCTAPAGTDAVDNGSITSIARQVVNILSLVIGALSVIMIIIGGFKYIVSAGASDKVTAAKNTILYAIIGLVIVALAQLIVHFVLNKTQDFQKPAATSSLTATP